MSIKDNIDKNATANLVQSHFHDTGISLFQLLDDENQRESLDCHGFVDTVYNINKLAPLPAEYTQPRKVYHSSEELFAPLCRFNYEDSFEYPELNLAKTEEQQWLQQFASFVDSAKSWAQYHIHEKCIQRPNVKDTNSLLPLLRDRVNTLDMLVHTVNLNIKVISALNPGQAPVDVSDYAVYALKKEAPFRFLKHFSIYFVIFGGLHIEQWLLVIYRQFIEESGLREILEASSSATIGVGAVVDVNQIKRTGYCVQVTRCSLYLKLVDAVKANGSTLDPWKRLEDKSVSSSMAHSWSLIINLQIEIFVFVRSIREGDFHLYVSSLRNLLKWFFTLDHTNNARWLIIYVFDLISLRTTHSNVYQQMLKGFF